MATKTWAEAAADEREEMRDMIENLNLYLSYIEKNHPEIFATLEDYFEGLPGYTGCDDTE